MRNPREILEILENPREASLRSAPLARRGPVLGEVSQPGQQEGAVAPPRACKPHCHRSLSPVARGRGGPLGTTMEVLVLIGFLRISRISLRISIRIS